MRVSRLMEGGAILASLYSAGNGVGLRTPVMVRQALSNSGLTLDAWYDLAQTGAQYSAVK